MTDVAHHAGNDLCNAIGWRISQIGTFGAFKSGDGFPLKYQGGQSGEIPFYKVSDMSGEGNATIMSDANHWISEGTRKVLGAHLMPPRSIIFAKIGAAIFLERRRILSMPSCVDNNVMAFIPDESEASALFFYYILQSIPFEPLVSTTALPSLSSKSIAAITRAFPPLNEQDKIASALKEIDDLIASLDALIAKKRDIKQAAMQQLLTGKTRLAGFTGEWQSITFGDVLRVCHGKDQKAIQCDGGRFPILATGGEIGRTNTPLYTKPSVLIGRKGTIDRPQFMEQPFWTVDTLFYTEILEPNSALYLFYVFQTVDWRSHNEASGVPSLSSKAIEGIPVNLPEPEEQAVIARTLADFDHEIAGVEKRRSKFRALREGMMQQLLTGKVRLI